MALLCSSPEIVDYEIQSEVFLMSILNPVSAPVKKQRAQCISEELGGQGYTLHLVLTKKILRKKKNHIRSLFNLYMPVI